jgi:predicted GNAT family acetyltransferase
MGTANELTLRDNADAERYEALTPSGEVAGYAEYRRGPTHVLFHHTVTEPAFEGQGVASRVVGYALDDTRQRSLKATATCPFVRSYIKRHPEYESLLANRESEAAS